MTSWADHFNTYEEACHYYGCDTPAQVEAEQRYYEQLGYIETQDELEAHGSATARSLATARQHDAWCRATFGKPASDNEMIRTALWGRTQGRAIPPIVDVYPDDIPF